MPDKPSFSIYWASSCGGCEISLLNTGPFFLDLNERFNLVFCPCLVDSKKGDLEEIPDGGIDLTLYNGAIRNSENEEMARLLREKSRILVAYGSCAHEGCVNGLSNLSSIEEHLEAVYLDNLSADNPGRIIPCEKTMSREGRMDLPSFYEDARPLADVVEIDYTIPGCPPERQSIVTAIDLLLADDPPPKGSVIGGGPSIVCNQCPRRRKEKKLKRLYRHFEIVPEEGCLLDQGIICMGIVTREGCGALCPRAEMPCTGCYGPAEGISDQGAKMASALGSILDIGETKGLSGKEIEERTDRILDAVPDYTGAFYKFSLAGSLLRRGFKK